MVEPALYMKKTIRPKSRRKNSAYVKSTNIYSAAEIFQWNGCNSLNLYETWTFFKHIKWNKIKWNKTEKTSESVKQTKNYHLCKMAMMMTRWSTDWIQYGTTKNKFPLWNSSCSQKTMTTNYVKFKNWFHFILFVGLKWSLSEVLSLRWRRRK